MILFYLSRSPHDKCAFLIECSPIVFFSFVFVLFCFVLFCFVLFCFVLFCFVFFFFFSLLLLLFFFSFSFLNPSSPKGDVLFSAPVLKNTQPRVKIAQKKFEPTASPGVG